MEKKYIIGIDGGGTKTLALVCDLECNILAEVKSRASNPCVVGKEKSANIIVHLIQKCCRAIKCNSSQIAMIVAGLAGAGRPSEQKEMKKKILEIARKRNMKLKNIIIESDVRIALEGAFIGSAGILVICGTGSIVCAKDPTGRIYRAGGWGRLISDEGSGYALGKEAFHIISRHLDGFTQKTRLIRLFKERLKLKNQDDIIKALYQDGFDMASVAPLVIESAASGDKISKNILIKSCNELMELIRIVNQKLSIRRKQNQRLPIAFCGSLVDNENLYSRLIRSAIRKKFKSIEIKKPLLPPAMGAVMLAKKILNSAKNN